MKIQLAEIKDLEEIKEVFEKAKKFMRENGNLVQWTGSYPENELLLSDINGGNLYKIINDGKICAVFAFIIGIDETYKKIYNGEWLNENEYGTIHRIASNNEVKGCFKMAFDFCTKKINDIRIDTHFDNKPMRNLVIKNGFVECGIIYIKDNSERIAYHYSKDN